MGTSKRRRRELSEWKAFERQTWAGVSQRMGLTLPQANLLALCHQVQELAGAAKADLWQLRDLLRLQAEENGRLRKALRRIEMLGLVGFEMEHQIMAREALDGTERG